MLKLAWRSLWRRRLRTFLAMLGMIIGVAAVIAMLSVGQGAKMAVESQIAGMGTNTIILYPGSGRRGGVRTGQGTGRNLTVEDYQAIQHLPYVLAAAPVVRSKVQVVFGSQNWSTNYTGTTPEFCTVRNWQAQSGRLFSEREVQSAAPVCLLGKTVREKLFGSSDPLGQVVRLDSLPCEVVGVMAEKGDAGFGGVSDDMVLLPYTTAQRRLQWGRDLGSIIVSAKRPDQVAAAEKQVLMLLRERHRVPEEEEEPYYSYNQAEILKAGREATQVFTTLLGSIGSVSLLVGGIGIMNIMLVSVTERIREIGIRMAIGARARDVMMQFLVEAVVLSVVGGTLGIALGVGVSYLLADVFQRPAGVSTVSVAISFGFSVLVGIFFGFYPAVQASRLDPIEALRHE
ncbi:MAG: ABC transporter permease [Candidatus Xenobia bacterium]